MKIDPRQAARLLRDPAQALASARLVLLYGENEGQIREYAQAFTKQVAGTLNDPFRVAELTREGWNQIDGEMAALSMMGGRRVVLVRDAGEAIHAHAKRALDGPGGALLILEAVGLSNGKLRKLAELAPDALSIACYPDEIGTMTELIRERLAESQIRIDPDALAWLGQALNGDRAVLRGEIEKLVLSAGPGGALSLEDVREIVGDSGASGADDAFLAAMGGDVVQADRALETAMDDGLGGVAVLRILLGQLQRAHQARLRMQSGGASAADAVRAMRPPVYFRAVGAMTACLTLWPADALLRAIEEARQAELACKQTGSRPELLARRFVAGLARQARARRQRA